MIYSVITHLHSSSENKHYLAPKWLLKGWCFFLKEQWNLTWGTYRDKPENMPYEFSPCTPGLVVKSNNAVHLFLMSRQCENHIKEEAEVELSGKRETPNHKLLKKQFVFKIMCWVRNSLICDKISQNVPMQCPFWLTVLSSEKSIKIDLGQSRGMANRSKWSESQPVSFLFCA